MELTLENTFFSKIIIIEAILANSLYSQTESKALRVRW
jgi:hypothetical protein